MSDQSLSTHTSATPPSPRIVSLDQFRGYTVLGMLLVNFLGPFKWTSSLRLLAHTHDYCSYADTIMPQFLFAVGFAFRLTFGRRAQREGVAVASAHVARRLLGLVLVSVVIYSASPRADSWNEFVRLGFSGTMPFMLKSKWFQTLMHIAVTSWWLLPVICSTASVRLSWMLVSVAAHIWLSYWFNFEWVNTRPPGVDGGPLGFLTWTVPAMFGTFACDVIVGAAGRPRLRRLVLWAFLLMGTAWVISCGTRIYDVPPGKITQLRSRKLAVDPVFPPLQTVKAHFQKDWTDWLAEPPFVPPPDQTHRKWNYWMMSQRGGTLAYPMFGAGFSLLVFAMFYVACDMGGYQWSVFTWFGVNALAAYVLHILVARAVHAFVPKDAPGWYVAASLLLYLSINCVIIRHLGKQKIYLKL